MTKTSNAFSAMLKNNDSLIQTKFDELSNDDSKTININDSKVQLHVLEKLMLVTDYKSARRFVRYNGFLDMSYVTISRSPGGAEVECIANANDLIAQTKSIKWLIILINAIKECDYEKLGTLVHSEKFQEVNFWKPEDEPKAHVRLTIKPRMHAAEPKKLKELEKLFEQVENKGKLPSLENLEKLEEFNEYKLWRDGEHFLNSNFSRLISPNDWKKNRHAQILLAVRHYVAALITNKLKNVQLKVQHMGEVTLHVSEPIEGIMQVLLNEFSGTSNIRICANKHCPTKFFFPEQKSKRKPRSDRHFCSRAGCQKWCHSNGLGPRKKG